MELAEIKLPELSQRKREILRRVVEHYVREVHAVSSSSIASEIGLSPATVRSEMAQLEEMGFLHQPHTSGGRIPTDLAYRFIVEQLIDSLAGTIEHRAKVMQVYETIGREAETLLEGTLDLLTEMTGYVAWVSQPVDTEVTIRSINFVEVERNQVLCVLVTGSGLMQNRMLQTEVPIAELNLGRLTDALNTYLRDKSIIDIDYTELRRIFHEELRVPEVLIDTLKNFFGGIAGTKDRVMFSNALQLVLQPEFAHVENLSSVLEVLNDKERFIRSLRTQFNARHVQTIIGSENTDPALKNCSLILSRFSHPSGQQGTVGVLGPTRLMYERTLPLVREVGEAVAQSLSRAASGGGD